MPTVESEKIKHKRNPWIVAVGIVLILGVLIGVGRGLWQWRVDLDKAEYTQLKLDDNKFRGAHKPDAAIAGWEKYRTGLPPRNYMYQADLFEGSLFTMIKDYPNALKIYRDAGQYRTGRDTGDLEGIAFIAEVQKDYATAIEYYGKEEAIYTQNKNSSEARWMLNHIEYLKTLVKP